MADREGAGMHPHLIICNAVLSKIFKLLTIAALDVQNHEEDRHPCCEDFYRICDMTKAVRILLAKLQL